MSEFKKELKQLQNTWDDSEKVSVGGSDVPVGSYIGVIQSAEIIKIKGEKLAVKAEYLIMDGEQKGKVYADFMHLGNEWGLAFLRRWLLLLDMEVPASLGDLPELLDEVTAKTPSIKFVIIQKGEYQNCKVLKQIDSDLIPESDDESEPEPEPEDDIPFDSDSDLDPTEEKEETADDSMIESVEAFMDEVGIDHDSLTTIKELKEELDGYEWEVETLKDDQVILLQSIGLVVAGAKPKPEPKKVAKKKVEKEEEEEKDVTPVLLELCKNFGVTLTASEKKNTKSIIAAMRNYEWTKADLEKDEIALLEASGAEVS